LSKGSPVQRFYGTEALRISPGAVNLDRMRSSGIPLLDSHQQVGICNALGRPTRAWFESGALMGELKFNDTREGQKAEGMVARGEIAGISTGYRVAQWEVTDEDGTEIDPDETRVSFDDDMTFTATRWELLEISLVSIPADSSAMIRSFGSSIDHASPPLASTVADAKVRMVARQRMYDRMRR
jgi:phage head maturation protease